MARESSQPVKTFAIGFEDEPSFDETEHARQVAGLVGGVDGVDDRARIVLDGAVGDHDVTDLELVEPLLVNRPDRRLANVQRDLVCQRLCAPRRRDGDPDPRPRPHHGR